MKLILAAVLLLINQITPSHSLTIYYQGEAISTVERSDFSHPFFETTFINNEKYKQLVEEIDHLTYTKPTNAKLDEKGQIVQERVGYKLNREKFTTQFYSYYFNDKLSKIEVPLTYIYPKVDSELLESIRVQKIGQYATYFNSRNKERTNNIALSTEAINNHVVFPGETFSFNKVVGKRTILKGYTRAPVIVRGELSEDIGGGICQVSSTLFNAIDRAGMKIVQRYSHSRSVRYVPPGRDATVSWYGPDFMFTNTYNQPILIRAKVYGGTVSVTIYSSDVINYEPRKVPSASEQLPKEVNLGSVNLQ